MAKLPKFTLSHDKKADDWKLKNASGNTVKSFGTKGEATAGGVLKKVIGGSGSVRIHKEKGGFQEERTFPRSADPKKTPG